MKRKYFLLTSVLYSVLVVYITKYKMAHVMRSADTTNNDFALEFPPTLVDDLHLQSSNTGESSSLLSRDQAMTLSIYSAFWDDRLKEGPVVRVLGLLVDRSPFNSKSEEPAFSLICYLKCPGSEIVYTIPEDKIEAHQIYNPRMLHNMRFFRYVFKVDLDKLTCENPEYISLRLSSTNEENYKPESLNVNNSLSVQYVQSSQTSMEFGACGPMLYNSTDPVRLVEWLEMMQILGVEQISLYAHTTLDATLMPILQLYQSRGLVDVSAFQFELDIDDKYIADYEVVYSLATLALADCMYKNMYRYQWMVVVDLDELILPTNVHTYQELFKLLPDPGQEHVGHKFVHTDFILDPVLTKTRVDHTIPEYLTLIRHRNRFPHTEGKYHPKSIINPRLCTAMHYHVCRGYLPGVDKARPVDTDMALDCHFRSHLCSKTTTTEKQCLTELNLGTPQEDDRMVKYRPRLKETMRKSLRELGLSEETSHEKSIL